MTEYGYEDPRSIFSKRNLESATRTPREILADIREKELREMSLEVRRFVLPLALFALMLTLFREQRIDEEAYIILRYARNIADGHGFVWNVGESPLWGSTSLLWTVLLGLSSAMTGVSVTVLAPVFGVGIAIAIIMIICQAAPNDLSATVLGSLVAVSALVGHALVGLDVLLFSLILLLTYLNRNDSRRLVVLTLLLSVTRPEGVILGGVFVLVHYVENRDIRVPVVFALVGGIVYLCILYYFGALVPNPLYVKTIAAHDTHSLFSRNLRDMLAHLRRMESLVPLALTAIYLLTRAKEREIWRVVLGLLPVFSYYVLYLFIHQTQNVLGRFQFAVVPVFYVISIAGVGGLFVSPKTRTHTLVLICIFGLLLAAEYSSTASVLSPHIEDENKVAVGMALSEIQDLTLATTDAGIVPYYSEWRAVDVLGLNDRTIAREGLSAAYLDGMDVHLFMTHSQTSNWSVLSTEPLFDAINDAVRYFVEERDFTLVMVNPYSIDGGVFNYYFIAPSFDQRDAVIQALCGIAGMEYAYNYLEAER